MQTSLTTEGMRDNRPHGDRSTWRKQCRERERDERRWERSRERQVELARRDAPRDSIRYRTCSSKVRYATCKQAEAAIRLMREKNRSTNADRLYVYYCHYCGGYHLAHMRPGISGPRDAGA